MFKALLHEGIIRIYSLIICVFVYTNIHIDYKFLYLGTIFICIRLADAQQAKKRYKQHFC